MIVEFVGFPASGKSTLQNVAVEGLRRRGVDVQTAATFRRAVREAGAPRIRVRSALRHGDLLWQAVMQMSVGTGRSMEMRLSTLKWLAVTLDTFDRARATDDDNHLVVFDEGPLQRAFLLFFEPGVDLNVRRLSRYLHRVPESDLLVRPVVDSATLVQRLQERPCRFRNLPDRLLQASIESAEECFDRIVQHRLQRNAAVLEIVNDDSEYVAPRLIEALARLMSRSSTRRSRHDCR